jgi:hypothetical protein
VISFKQLSEKASAITSKISRKTWIWIGLGVAALPALRIFYVQEMLAALIGFSLLFAAIYITVFAIFLLVRGSEPVIAWARPRVGQALHWSAETAESAVANSGWTKALPAWAKTVPHRLRRQQVRVNENYRVVYTRLARLGPWAIPKVRRVAHWSAETGTGVAWGAIASPAWAKAVPAWAKSLPHGFRKQQLKLNENYNMVRLRLALSSRQVYNVSLQKGGAVLAIGLRTQKTISSQVGNWLRQPVRYPDFIRLRPISQRRSSARELSTRPRG